MWCLQVEELRGSTVEDFLAVPTSNDTEVGGTDQGTRPHLLLLLLDRLPPAAAWSLSGVGWFQQAGTVLSVVVTLILRLCSPDIFTGLFFDLVSETPHPRLPACLSACSLGPACLCGCLAAWLLSGAGHGGASGVPHPHRHGPQPSPRPPARARPTGTTYQPPTNPPTAPFARGAGGEPAAGGAVVVL